MTGIVRLVGLIALLWGCDAVDFSKNDNHLWVVAIFFSTIVGRLCRDLAEGFLREVLY